ncbi:hypothetical protein [Streptomyces sp. NPDC044948]|uniref:hypothetical protein n=1 Tax=Streptomyces sp. NPDC044948 TaxID=3157092 RepID=UPI0033C985E4
MKFSVKERRLVSRLQMRGSNVSVAARNFETPLGEISLSQGPTKRNNPQAMANGHQEWNFDSKCAPRAVIFEVVDDSHLLARLIKTGVRGEVEGVPFEVRARSALLPKNRKVDFLGGIGTFKFRTNGFRVHVGDERGVVMATANSVANWNASTVPTPELLIVIVMFVALDANFFMQSPLWRNF